MTKLRAILRRRWALLAAATVVGLVAGALSGLFASASADKEQVFTASQTIVANQGSGANPLIPQDELKVTRGAVPDKAAELLGRPGEGAVIAGSMSTAFDTESGSITISSNDVNAQTAQQRVDAFVRAFLEITNTRLQADSRRQVDQYNADLQAAQQQLAQLEAAHPELTQPGAPIPTDLATQELLTQRSDLQTSIQQLSQQARDAELQLSRTAPYESLGPEAARPASTGLVSVPTSIPVRMMLLGLLGLLLGGVVATVIERVNRRIDTRDELVAAIDLPILAEVGYLKANKRAHDADGVLKLEGVWAEPYRRVRSAIQFVQVADDDRGAGSGPPRVFLVTSTSPGEGKSTTSVMTGQALAEVGEPTVVVGGDFRRPEVDRLLGVAREPSILDMAQMSLSRPSVDEVVRPSRFESLYVAPAGRGTREVSGSIEAAKEIVREAAARGATVVVDSSPLQAANDTVDLLPVVDYVILVVRSGRATEAGLGEVVDTLQRMDAKILGMVLIGTPTAGRRQTYYYDYYSPAQDPAPGQGGHSGQGGQNGPVPGANQPPPAAPHAPTSAPAAAPTGPPPTAPAPTPGATPAPEPVPVRGVVPLPPLQDGPPSMGEVPPPHPGGVPQVPGWTPPPTQA